MNKQMNIRTCAKCNRTLWPWEMSTNGSRCKSCEAERQREWRHRRPEQSRLYSKNYCRQFRALHPGYDNRMRDKEKKAAQNTAYYKVKNDNAQCEVCESIHAQRHHDDYSKPLEIRWLCPLHHKEVHKGKRRQCLDFIVLEVPEVSHTT